MKSSLPTNPATAKALMTHLCTWGEVAVCELAAFPNSAQWLGVFKETGLVTEVESGEGAPAAWVITPLADVLLDIEAEVALSMHSFKSRAIGVISSAS